MKTPFKINSVLIMFTTIILLNSCKKYEDDGHWITFRKPKNRIFGNYILKELKVNTINYTDSIGILWGINNIYEFNDEKFYSLNEYNRPPAESSGQILVSVDNNLVISQGFPMRFRGRFGLNKNKEKLSLYLICPADIPNFISDGKSLWDYPIYPFYLNSRNYPRMIDGAFNILKLDKYGLVLTRNNGDRIVFERIE
jgi:hypothetical protein